MRGTATTYKVFVRNWWRRAGHGEHGWPDGLVPDPGARKTTIATRCTYEEALAVCERYNNSHRPGKLSRKAEFTEE